MVAKKNPKKKKVTLNKRKTKKKILKKSKSSKKKVSKGKIKATSNNKQSK